MKKYKVKKPIIPTIHSRQLKGLKMSKQIHKSTIIVMKGRYIRVPTAIIIPKSNMVA
jgi:hypothetical protein